MHAATTTARRVRSAPTRATPWALAFALITLMTAFVVLPHGRMASIEYEGLALFLRVWGNVFGTLAVLLVLASLLLAHDLPVVRRVPLARRRLLHRRIGVGVIATSGLHVALFLVEGSFRGWMPGVVSFAAFGLHGATGAMKGRFITAWGPRWWRFVHRASAWVALAFVAEHVLIASWHYGLAPQFAEWGIGR